MYLGHFSIAKTEYYRWVKGGGEGSGEGGREDFHIIRDWKSQEHIPRVSPGGSLYCILTWQKGKQMEARFYNKASLPQLSLSRSHAINLLLSGVPS